YRGGAKLQIQSGTLDRAMSRNNSNTGGGAPERAVETDDAPQQRVSYAVPCALGRAISRHPLYSEGKKTRKEAFRDAEHTMLRYGQIETERSRGLQRLGARTPGSRSEQLAGCQLEFVGNYLLVLRVQLTGISLKQCEPGLPTESHIFTHARPAA